MKPLAASEIVTTPEVNPPNSPSRKWLLAAWFGLLAGCFARPLLDLTGFAWGSDLYSYILLIPFVSAGLIWLRRHDLAWAAQIDWPAGGILIAIGLALPGAYLLSAGSGWRPAIEDYLALLVLGFVTLVIAGGFFFLGRRNMRRIAFPVALLLFAAPFPSPVLAAVESFLQRHSADAAQLLFTVSGMPVLRDGLRFQLPGFSLQVAPECSGIHSTLALFISGLVAGYLLLNNPLRRAALALAVIPLALLRNGFRIFVVGQLCVRVGPEMINSYIHRKGGPIFFALSLVPFFGMLLWFRRKERGLAGRKAPSTKPQAPEKLQAPSSKPQKAVS